MSLSSSEKVPVQEKGGTARLSRRYPWTARVVAPAGSLDDALSWALDTYVMAKNDVRGNIEWQGPSTWRSLHALTKKEIQGKKLVNDKPVGPGVTVPAHADVAVTKWKAGRYLCATAIGDDDFAEIEAASDDLTGLDESIPWASSAKPVGIICHQLAPYIACKSDLRGERNFYQAMLADKGEQQFEFWLDFCDAELGKEVIQPDKAIPEQFSRGDFVVFYRSDGFAHVATATGRTAKNGSPSLYSLWNNRENHPIIDDIAGICACTERIDAVHPVTAIRTATPAWYLRD